MDPTTEQQAILDSMARSASNLQVNAYAGTGKTATLELIQAQSTCPTLCLAFNRAVADEMEEKFGKRTTVKTINGLGHSIWGRTCTGKVVLDGKKVPDILRGLIGELDREERTAAWDGFWDTVAAVGLAKSLGYVPDGAYPNAKRLITWDDLGRRFESPAPKDLVDECLLVSIRQAYTGLIDFNDQIYMPALFGGAFPRFPLVLVDEAQDLSPTNHQMLKKLRGSRIISVGDPFQSIYQFRGACQDGMGKLRDHFVMEELPLSVSWRCPSEIVKNARWRVPEFKWSREGGQVLTGWAMGLSEFPEDCAVICRNNAPLFKLAFRLIQAGRAVTVAGSDIGPKIVGIMRKFGDDSMPRAYLLDAIGDWANRKVAAGSKTANDLAATMIIFAEQARDLGQAL